jgi:hypothetical protein
MPPGSPMAEREHSIYGTLKGLQPIAVTNNQGEFEISYDQPTSKMLLEVEARAMAPKFVVMTTGSERHSVAVSEGSTITGRLTANGKPVPNALVGLIAKNRGGFQDNLKISGNPYEELRIGTGPNGHFTITNVPGPVDWYLYAKMESVSSLGATTPIEVNIARDGQYLTTPDLVIRPGYRVRGIVIVSDKRPISEGMRLTISSEIVWDTQTVPLAPDGHFEFLNLPPGKYTITTSVKGYHENAPRYGPMPFLVDRNVDNFTTSVYPNVP